MRSRSSPAVPPAGVPPNVTTVMLDFGDGTTAMFTVSTQLEPFQRACIFGTEGRIEIKIPVNMPLIVE